MTHLLPFILNLLILLQLGSAIRECIPSKINPQACMCNSTYCDDIPSINWCPERRNMHLYITSNNGDRFDHTIINFPSSSKTSGAYFTVTINPCKTYQKIIGFGGAMTDAAALMISCLSKSAKENLINSYFHCDKGIAYNLMRTPIGGSDYSEKFYTYDDTSDPDLYLRRFALNEVDIKYKIPAIKLAQSISCKNIHIKGATWNSPLWMSTPKSDNLTKLLLENLPPEMVPFVLPAIPTAIPNIDKYCVKSEYQKIWAQYIIKAIKAYKSFGVNIDILSGGNEIILLNCYEPERYKNWMVNYLYPEIRKAGLNITLLAMDDQTPFLTNFLEIFEDSAGRYMIDGIATHSYLDFIPDISNAIQKDFCTKYPEKILISTEFCICKHEGANYYETSDWEKAERYADDIINKLTSCSQGYIDWNMALNSEGGPNYINNFCYSPIEVDCSADEFYKKYVFYVLGHFSKFVPEGSVRIEAIVEISPYIKIANLIPLKVVAFRVKSAFCLRQNIVAIILNQNEFDVTTNLCIGTTKCAVINIPKKSITSTVSLQTSSFIC